MDQDRNEFRPSFINRIQHWVTLLFGTFNYAPPIWLKGVFGKIGSIFSAGASKSAPLLKGALETRKTNPRKFWMTTGGIAAGLVGLTGLIYWYANRPEPTRFEARGEGPQQTYVVEGGTFRIFPAYVTFTGSAARLDLVGKVITQGIKTSPKIDGEWRWLSDSRLSFQPKADWPVGQEFTVYIEKSILGTTVNLDTYKPTFKTKPFEVNFYKAEFYQDPKVPRNKSVTATFTFSHPVNAKDFEKRISLSMSGAGVLKTSKSIPFTVTYDKFKFEAYVQSDIIPIPDKDAKVVIKADTGIRAAAGGPSYDTKLTREVTIPGMFTYFRVNGASLSLVRNERYEPEQVLIVETSATVGADELNKNLEAFVLPVDRPGVPGIKGKKKYRWSRPDEIGPEILKQSEKLELKPIPTELEFSELHSYKYKAAVGRYIYIRINKGTRSYGDYVLAKEFAKVNRVPAFPQEVKIMADGALLSLSGAKKISVLSRDIEAIRFQVSRVVAGQVNHLITQSSGSFADPYFNYSFTEENISEVFEEVRPLQVGEAGKTQYSAFDFTEYLSKGTGGARRGLFYFRAEAWDPVRKQTTGMSDKRLILVSDLGVLLKQAKDGTSDVFVQNIHTGRPVTDASVEVLGKNGLAVLTSNTNGEGQAKFPSLKDFSREKEPTAYVVRRGSDFSFLPFKRSDRHLDFSRFDIGGEVTEIEADRLNAYLFSDRGIYRPGDLFNIGMIVKSSDWRPSPPNLPLEVVVLSPTGLEVSKKKMTLSSIGLEEFSYQTQENAPTGHYQVQVYIARDKKKRSLLGSTTVRVEEFLPDRMRIQTRFSLERPEGWVKPKDLKGNVSLKNLFGLAAIKHKITADLKLSPSFPSFRSHKDYRFFDPAQTQKNFSETLGTQETNEQGEAVFDLNLERFDRASYRVVFAAEGFELEGGRSVSSQSAALVSPLDYMVGYKTDGDFHYVNKDSARAVEYIAIDPEMKKIEVKGLQLSLIELRYVSALTKQSNGTFKYQSVRKEIPVSKTPFTIPAAGLKHPLITQNPGDFALVILDESGTQLSRVEYSVAGQGNLARSLEKNAELQLKLNKGDFTPGEEIELQIVAPYTGSGLITIEREKIYAFKWFTTNATSTIQKIKVPAGLEGNGYVNVSFVRSMDSQEIFMSPLSYAVAPFSISRDRRVNNIELDVPERAWPGEPYKIKYKASKPGKLVVFAVDEGILQVARYKTPEPLSFFFQKKALEMDTSQILDQILPEFEILKSMAAAGGGEGEGAFGKNLNPFKRKREKPVVYWSGILNTDGKPGTLTYQMPDYFSGSVKVFAVVVSQDAVGVATKSSFVRGHFVLSPNVPTFVAPGDEFNVTVGVTNDVPGSGKNAAVSVEMETSKHLEIIDKPKGPVTVEEGHEESVGFRVKAKDNLGSASLIFRSSLGDKKAKYSVDLSVRPAVPKMTELRSGYLKKTSATVPISREMYPHFRTANISLSNLPLGLSRGLLAFLEDYPYGCTEQLVSKAFPALVLKKMPEFGYSPKKVEERLDQTFTVLRARQNSEGAFGYWAANSFVSEFMTVYATHFLTEANEAGYAVSRDMLGRAISYLKLLATKDSDNLNDQRAVAYAIYVLARNGVIPTTYITSLRKKLPEDGKWKTDLVGIYLAATYQILQQPDQAWAILKNNKLGDPQSVDYVYYYDELVRDSQLLYLLAKHFPDRARSLDGEMILAALKPIEQGRYNSLNSAYAVQALAAYAELLTDKPFVSADLFEIREDKKEKQIAIAPGLFPVMEWSEQAKNLRIMNKSEFNLFYMMNETGFDREMPKSEIREKLEIVREFQDDKGKVLTEIKLGDQVEVHVKVRALSSGGASIAIVDLLPGGFEPVIESAHSTAAGENRFENANPSGGDSPNLEDGDGEFGEVEEEASNRRPHHRPHAQLAGPLSFPVGISKSTWQPDYVDIREDRLLMFGWIGDSVKEFVYRVKATTQGDYVTPPAFAESMYDRGTKARGMAGRVKVLPNK